MSDDPNWLLCSQVAADVYNSGKGNQTLLITNGLVSVFGKRDGSFYGAIYSDDAGDLIVAIRGTDDYGDWWANVEDGLGAVGFNNQFQDTLSLIETAKQLAAPGTSLTLTGHSLGGGLAALAGAYLKIPAYVFDPAPFNVPNAVTASILLPDLLQNGIFQYNWVKMVNTFVQLNHYRAESCILHH